MPFEGNKEAPEVGECRRRNFESLKYWDDVGVIVRPTTGTEAEREELGGGGQVEEK